MRKSRITLITLAITFVLSIIIIIFLEDSCFQPLRDIVVIVIPFLKGKKGILCNVFLGILASSFCMYIGEFVALKCLKNELKKEIVQLFEELWIKIYFKDGISRQDYIDNAIKLVQYSDKIIRLNEEYESKKGVEYLIIRMLYFMTFYFKAIYETEYMRDSNNAVFKIYVEKIYEIYDKDLKKLYYESEYDEDVMQIRKSFEKSLNDCIKNNKGLDASIDSYIERIKEIEEQLDNVYDKMNKSGKYFNWINT